MHFVAIEVYPIFWVRLVGHYIDHEVGIGDLSDVWYHTAVYTYIPTQNPAHHFFCFSTRCCELRSVMPDTWYERYFFVSYNILVNCNSMHASDRSDPPVHDPSRYFEADTYYLLRVLLPDVRDLYDLQ